MKNKSSTTKRLKEVAVASSSTRVRNPPLLHNLKVQHFKIGRALGDGGFAVVKRATWITTGKVCALKIIDEEKIRAPPSYHDIHDEVKVMKALGRTCPFVVQLQGILNDGITFGLALEFVEGGDLFKKVYDQRGLSEAQACFYVAEIACALEFLQSKKIIHRDLKLDNILITADGHAKLTDFGLAIFVSKRKLPNIPAGAFYIRPPEMLRKEPYTYAVDWYALGLNLFEMIAARNPFDDIACVVHDDKIHDLTPDACITVMALEGELYYPSRISDVCVKLIRDLTTKEQAQRPQNLSDIIQQPCFGNIDWQQVRSAKMTPPPGRASGSGSGK